MTATIADDRSDTASGPVPADAALLVGWRAHGGELTVDAADGVLVIADHDRATAALADGGAAVVTDAQTLTADAVAWLLDDGVVVVARDVDAWSPAELSRLVRRAATVAVGRVAATSARRLADVLGTVASSGGLTLPELAAAAIANLRPHELVVRHRGLPVASVRTVAEPM